MDLRLLKRAAIAWFCLISVGTFGFHALGGPQWSWLDSLYIKRAGATSVVAPNALGGLRLASEMIRPRTTSFLDRMLYHSGGDTRMDEAVLPKGSPWDGKFLSQANIHDSTGVVPVAIHMGGDDFLFNPPPHHVLHAGQAIIAVGSGSEIDRLRRHLGG